MAHEAYPERAVTASRSLPESVERREGNLAVAVQQEDEGARRAPEAGAQGGPVPAVGLVDDLQAPVGACESIEDRSRGIPAAVVDDDQLRPGDRVEHVLLHLAHGGLDRPFLVVDGHDGRQGRGHRRAAAVPLGAGTSCAAWAGAARRAASAPPVRTSRPNEPRSALSGNGR